MLSYLAARTSRIRLGSGVVVLPLHNPIHVAEEAAMVDVLSGGRVELGVGRGYQSVEFDGFGQDLSEARERFDEALDVVTGLWGNDVFHHAGKYYRTGEVTLIPRPLQQSGPPIYVAAVSPETVELYARRGLPILADPAAPFRKVAQAAETWHRIAAEAGHDTSNTDLVISRSVWLAPTIEQARADQEEFEKAFDRSRIFNEKSAPIDTKTGKTAKGFEFWEGRYLKGGSVGTDFRWEQLEVIGDPERVIGQVKMLQRIRLQPLDVRLRQHPACAVREHEAGDHLLRQGSHPRLPLTTTRRPGQESKGDTVHDLTVADVVREHRRSRPDVVALVDGDTRISYRQFDERTNRLATAMLTAGRGPG